MRLQKYPYLGESLLTYYVFRFRFYSILVTLLHGFIQKTSICLIKGYFQKTLQTKTEFTNLTFYVSKIRLHLIAEIHLEYVSRNLCSELFDGSSSICHCGLPIHCVFRK